MVDVGRGNPDSPAASGSLASGVAAKLPQLRAVAAGLLIAAAGYAFAVIGFPVQNAASAYGYQYEYCGGAQYQYCPPPTTTTTPTTATLTVIKHVVNDNKGTASASQFTLTITGVTAVGGNTFPGEEAPGTTKTVSLGSYGVTETGPAGYVAFLSADCSGTIAGGEAKTCTVTNNDIGPRQTIGYWRNHPEQTTALLPQLLGSYAVTTFAQAAAVIDAANCSSSKADAIACLAAQLLAAKLNLANASDPCIQATVTKTNSFLNGGTVTAGGVTATGIVYTGPGSYPLTSTQRSLALILKNALDSYNNGKKCANP